MLMATSVIRMPQQIPLSSGLSRRRPYKHQLNTLKPGARFRLSFFVNLVCTVNISPSNWTAPPRSTTSKPSPAPALFVHPP